MKYIDTHAHVNFKKFSDDADQVILNSLNNQTGMVVVGSDYKTSKRALDLANKYERGVYAAVGLHPIHLEDIIEEDEEGRKIIRVRAEEFNYDNYEKLAEFEKTVAIGEIGLDYHHLKLSPELENSKKKQKEVFIKQLLLARDFDLPAIVHCRVAHDDLLSTLKKFKEDYKELIPADKPWGVIHCFSGDENLAWEYFRLGFFISFTGIITFSRQWDNLIRKMPLDKFMIETDCPFMTPEPYRGTRNEPILVAYVAERIAAIRGSEPDRIAEISTENAKKFFNIV
ncbi:MAG TPA: TatD family hydrolase [Candidatus Methylomirabilis sp.]|nr:TatD family hydrolase [Candidatus Methylomirabilis sp.]